MKVYSPNRITHIKPLPLWRCKTKKKKKKIVTNHKMTVVPFLMALIALTSPHQKPSRFLQSIFVSSNSNLDRQINKKHTRIVSLLHPTPQSVFCNRPPLSVPTTLCRYVCTLNLKPRTEATFETQKK